MSVSENEPLLRAALYIRVSTHSQEELSPDSQKRLLLEYARSRRILVDPEHIYIEKGISGRRADRRPRFQQMIAAAKSPLRPFDMILVWKFSRFARNQEESIVYKSMLKKLCSVEVVSISEPLESGPFGSLTERIIEWMDEFYSIRLSGDVFRGMTEKALRGGCQCRPPLGYRLPAPGQTPEIVEEEAGIVRLIFQAYGSEGVGLSELCRRLNRLGMRTAKGNPFEKRAVKYILQNPFYAGNIRWNRTDGASRPKPRDQWILARGSHPPLVSPDLFLLVQQRLEEEGRSGSSRSSLPLRHWLSGLMVCPACGRSLSSCIRRRKTMPDTVLFQCTGYLKGSCSCSCYLPESAAVPALLQSLESVFSHTSLVFSPDSPQPAVSADPLLRASLLRSLRQAREGIRRASDAYLAGIDSAEEYKTVKTRLTAEVEELNRRLSQNSRSDPPETDSVPYGPCPSFRELLSSPSCSLSAKNRALRSIILNMVFSRPENRLEIIYRDAPPKPQPSTHRPCG